MYCTCIAYMDCSMITSNNQLMFHECIEYGCEYSTNPVRCMFKSSHVLIYTLQPGNQLDNAFQPYKGLQRRSVPHPDNNLPKCGSTQCQRGRDWLLIPHWFPVGIKNPLGSYFPYDLTRSGSRPSGGQGLKWGSQSAPDGLLLVRSTNPGTTGFSRIRFREHCLDANAGSRLNLSRGSRLPAE